jgi:hypothetical protein
MQGALLREKRRYDAKAALLHFRGTLLDGVLRKDVRLGNGLSIIGNVEPQLSSEDTKDVVQEVPTKASRSSPTSSSYRQRPKPSFEHQNAKRRNTELDIRIALLETKEREMEHREEILRWKHKAWRLEQELAQQNRSFISKPLTPPQEDMKMDDLHPPMNSHVDHLEESGQIAIDDIQPQRDTDMDDLQLVANESAESLKVHNPDPELQPENADEPFPFNLAEPAAPQALKAIRSRMALPSRRTLRST